MINLDNMWAATNSKWGIVNSFNGTLGFATSRFEGNKFPLDWMVSIFLHELPIYLYLKNHFLKVTWANTSRDGDTWVFPMGGSICAIILRYLQPATFLKKRLWHRSFPVKFKKFLRTPFLTEHFRWLLLQKPHTNVVSSNRFHYTVISQSPWLGL